jgi:hypothetical protein
MTDERKDKAPPEPRRKDENIPEHLIKTGLPPGIEPEQAQDPGKGPPGEKPTDNRS